MGKWISVHDLLPESSGSYIVATKNGGVMMTHFYASRNGEPGHFSSSRINSLVTHWMERPLPPEIKESVTNADAIRSMTDEELAEFLDRVNSDPCEACCNNLYWCRRNNAPEPICKRHYLSWLKDKGDKE
ncbi:MAG: DUF551 domain-containing protein [Lachnospiraceae bacterium]|nr:DUF551 domain-containing protein [Lachnospiraceae bacterium]